MKIELKYPYTEKWKSAYLNTNRENRKTVYLYNGKSRSSTSYARYLMATHLKRFLLSEEHIDHIDNDKTNDVLENLQILTRLQNSQKSAKGKTYTNLKCQFCGKEFKREKRLLCSPRKTICCSRSCSVKLQFKINGLFGR